MSSRRLTEMDYDSRYEEATPTVEDTAKWEAVADHKQFVSDMEDAGLAPYDYHGRFFWHGPAVDVDDLQEALGATKVRCQWDSMGMGYVVYPNAGRSER
jgi:hypothetical protein